MFPGAARRVHRIEVRIGFDQTLNLLLAESYGCFKQLPIRLMYKLDHWNLPAMLPF